MDPDEAKLKRGFTGNLSWLSEEPEEAAAPSEGGAACATALQQQQQQSDVDRSHHPRHSQRADPMREWQALRTP